MGVIEAKAGRPGHEGDAAHAVRGHEGRAFLGRAVHVARDHLAVPVHQFGRVGVVVNVDDDPLAFLESQQRPRKLPVVQRGRDDVVGAQFDETGRDPQGVVGLFRGGLFGGPCRT